MSNVVASLNAPLIKRLCLMLAAAAIIGAALLLPRGTDLRFAPTMAESPVVLDDGKTVYVQKYEVSIVEWNACFADGGCRFALRAPANRSAAEMPATGLSYLDVTEYVTWMNDKTGHTFRLPTLDEWNTMAAEVMPETYDPIFSEPELSWASSYLVAEQTVRALRPQGSFETTAQGIVDLNGSVWEWTQDCYAGVDFTKGQSNACPSYFVGGEHIAAIPLLVRDPARGGCAVGTPPAHLGMRLVTDKPLL